MSICQLKCPWEYDEIAQLSWLPQEVCEAFQRFSDRNKNSIAFKYMLGDHIEGVGIGKFVENELGRQLVIGHLEVKENARNKGIGTALLNRFLHFSSQSNMTCRLQVARLNWKARRLYKRFNFSELPDEQDQGALWMARSA